MVTQNRLAGETSPYLLQHADNPVNWQPWDATALAEAADGDRPLFISIGYAACHWCHVMAHESFEDPVVAELINRSFVAIKIDREERPDLDQLYMTATQAATGHGGWPMTVFATPDGRPFFAGTYFPPIERHGQPSFSKVLLALEEAWGTQREAIEAQADELAKAVAKEAGFVDAIAAEALVDDLDLDRALDALVADLATRFDAEHGGFGGAPKFPRPSYLEALLTHHRRTGDPLSLSMATTTLDAMAAGGIYDHLAGGFARYSVDSEWRVPHFEKMLTDQALLARCYLHAFEVTGEPSYRQVVVETLRWVLDHLGLPHGGLASSVDADAAGVEGSHAVFTPAEIATSLQGVDGALSASEACRFYSVTEEGSFEHGSSVLARDPALSLLRTPAEEITRRALLDTRERRAQPALDDKVLVEWNAMAASVLAEAAGALGIPEWGDAARQIVTNLDQNHRSAEGRLLRAGRAGRMAHLAMLGDYAWLLEALTRLFELDGDDHWIDRAHLVAGDMIALFHDGQRASAMTPEVGAGFFTTGSDAEVLLVRTKDLFDGALPSATSVAATGLSRLALITGDTDLLAVADRTVAMATKILRSHPAAVPDLILALGLLRSSIEVAVPGPAGPLLDAARGSFIPFSVIVTGSSESTPLFRDRLPGFAYVCRHGVCDLPSSEPDSVKEQVDRAVAR